MYESYYNFHMFITMNIVADALREFDTESKLTNGSAPLQGIKINEIAENHVTASQEKDAVVLKHGKDQILVKNAGLDRTINTILDTAREGELWERALYHMIFNGCSLQDIAEKAYGIFHNPIFFVDETDHVLARTHHELGEVNEAWDSIINTGYLPLETTTITHEKMNRNLSASQRRGKNVPFLFSPPTTDIDNRGINYLIYSPLSHERVGTLIIIENETPVTLGMLNLAEVLTDAVDEWMNMHKEDHPFKTSRNLIQELIETPEQVERKEVLNRYIAPCKNGYRLALITGCGHVPREQIEKMITDTLKGSLAYKYGEEVVAVIPLTETDEEIQKHLDMVLYYQGARVGLSYPFFDLTSFNSYYHQAKVALSYGTEKFAGIRPEIAMRYFTDETSKDIFGANMAHPALEKLKEYDAKHGGELYKTLYYFLRHERSLIDSSRALNIHRNSLIYRIDKIRQLTDVDLDDADIREYLLFSYRITGRP